MYNNGMQLSGVFDESEFFNNYPVHRACRDGDLQTVNSLLQLHPEITMIEDAFKNWTPLHWAAAFGRLDCVKQVTSAAPNVIHVQSSKTFQLPLHCAAEANQAQCILWFLHVGANFNVKDNLGETALHKAAKMGHAECVSLLVAASPDVSAVNNFGQTACSLAEISGFPAVAAYLRRSEELSGSNNAIGGFRPQMRFGRKRNFNDMIHNEGAKRTCIRDTGMILAPVLDEAVNMVTNTMTTSVVEHEKLCRMEHGYSKSILETMFTEFHGC